MSKDSVQREGDLTEKDLWDAFGESIERCREGVARTVAFILRNYNKRPENISRKVVNIEIEAENLAGETILVAMLKIQEAQAAPSLQDWLNRISVRLTAEWLRHRAIEPLDLAEEFTTDDDPKPLGVLGPKTEQYSELFLRQAIEELRDPQQKRCLKLRFLKGEGIRGIAEIMEDELNMNVTDKMVEDWITEGLRELTKLHVS